MKRDSQKCDVFKVGKGVVKNFGIILVTFRNNDGEIPASDEDKKSSLHQLNIVVLKQIHLAITSLDRQGSCY